ncbi:MAG: PilX N-terminal domain-containing pilus assembly protein [bacterium]
MHSETYDQQGAALLLAMIMLVILTLLGMFSLHTSTTEIQICGNEKKYFQNFYVCDSGWKVMAAYLNEEALPPSKVNPSLGDNIVRNFGNGGDGVTNETFPVDTEDGTLGDIPYWNKIEYISDAYVPGCDKNYRNITYTVTTNANRQQEVEVVVQKVFKIGY